ncbi:MAG: hypothetical protein ACOX1R_01425 [Caldicoprobacterales bacterium]|jgi:hypothetical protein
MIQSVPEQVAVEVDSDISYYLEAWFWIARFNTLKRGFLYGGGYFLYEIILEWPPLYQ